MVHCVRDDRMIILFGDGHHHAPLGVRERERASLDDIRHLIMRRAASPACPSLYACVCALVFDFASLSHLLHILS